MSNIAEEYLKRKPKNIRKSSLQAFIAQLASAPNSALFQKHSKALKKLLEAVELNEQLAAFHKNSPANLNKMRNFFNGVIKPTHANLAFLIKMSTNYYSQGNNKLANATNNLIRKIPRKVWKPVPYTGKVLFHGTKNVLKGNYPNKKEGNWFAESVHQSVLHAFGQNNNKTSKKYLYVYHVRSPAPKLIHINAARNFANFVMNITRGYRSEGNWNFSNANYNTATELCQMKIADGWYFPRDQTQVMLCDPKKFLKIYRIYEITGGAPTSPSFRIKNQNTAMWIREKGTVYGLKKIWPRPHPQN